MPGGLKGVGRVEWPDVLKLDPIHLNLGGCYDCHPQKGYRGYVSVDLKPRRRWAVAHDLTTPLPLPDGVVSRIHSEDFIEHIRPEAIEKLLAECHRVLKPGAFMRIGCPDYNGPLHRHCLELGHDPDWPLHITLTTHDLVKEIVERSPFARHKFYHYWDGDRHVEEPIDWSLGLVTRTPDTCKACRREGWWQKWRGRVADEKYRRSKNGNVTELEMLTRKGHRLHVTTLVFDLFKD